MSSIGNNSQFSFAPRIRFETTYAAAKRTTRVSGSTGHQAGFTTQTNSASGKGMVNNCPR